MGLNLPRSPLDILSVRQLQILELVAIQRTNGQIADCLGISRSTVKRHVEDILNRLGVASRQAAGDMFREHADTNASDP